MRYLRKGFMLVLLFVLLINTRSVYGYLDPGTGSYVIQIILAAILSLGVGVRIFWSKIKRFFKKKSADQEDIE